MTPDDEQPEFSIEQFRDALALKSNADLEEFFEQLLPKISNASRQAAANQDKAGMQRVAAGIAAYQTQLSTWNDGLGRRASKKLKGFEELLGKMRDDIGAALRGELPGQAAEGDEWKDGQ